MKSLSSMRTVEMIDDVCGKERLDRFYRTNIEKQGQKMATDKVNKPNIISPFLKSWKYKGTVIESSSTSNCGKFICVSGNSGFEVVHLINTFQELIAPKQTTKSCKWSECVWKKDRQLSFPTTSSFIALIDDTYNILIYAIADPPKCELMTLVGSSLLQSHQYIEEVTDVLFLALNHSRHGDNFNIWLLVNQQTLLYIIVPSKKEPYIHCDNTLQGFPRQTVKTFKCSTAAIYILTHNALLYILEKSTLNILKELDLKVFGCDDTQSFDIFSDCLLVVIDSNKNLILHELSKDDLTKTKKLADGSWESRRKKLRLQRKDKFKKETTLFNHRAIETPDWFKRLQVVCVHVTSATTIYFECRDRIYTTFDQGAFAIMSMPSDACLSFSEGNFPPLIATPTQISLPIFNVSQELLVNKVIEYSDITAAEGICRTNKWSQFSIPLHTLQVALQHKQLDTVQFFLKTREKVFTSYWSSPNPTNVTNPEEMMQTIEMLHKTIQDNSTGEHKKNFYENLVKLTTEYINKLIRDAVKVLKIKSTTQTTVTLVQGHEFYYDLRETLKYLSQQVVRLREQFEMRTKPSVDGVDETDLPKAQMEFSEQLVHGNVASLQKHLIDQGLVNDSQLVQLIEQGKHIAVAKLYENNMESAKAILINMGLDVNTELKTIFMNSKSFNLRENMHRVLCEKKILSEEEVEDFNFLNKLKNYYPKQKEKMFEYTLNDIKWWDASTRKKIMFDAIFMGPEIETIPQQDSRELWDYFLSHHRLQLIAQWLSGEVKEFPTFDVVDPNINDVPDFIRTRVLDCLVQNGYYPKCLTEDRDLFIQYMARNDLLFTDAHPMDGYKYPVDDRQQLRATFDHNFVEYCEQHQLPMLLWEYLTHYNVAPTVCDDRELNGWLKLMLDMYGYTKGKTSLSGCMLSCSEFLEDKPVTLTGLVENDQLLLALSIALLSKQPLDQIVCENASTLQIEKGLLREAIQMYPKLSRAFFPQPEDDISVYKLIQDNTDLDVTQWFTWQPSNNLAIKDEHNLEELPHFSHPQLVKSYANEVWLDFDYHLRHACPVFAYLAYQRDFEKLPSWDSVYKAVFKIALEEASNATTIKASISTETDNSSRVQSACCFFLELCGHDSEQMRVDCKVVEVITRNKRHNKNQQDVSSVVVNSLYENTEIENVLKLLEDSIEIVLHENKIKRFSYKAICYWQLAVRFCRCHHIPTPRCFMQACCKHQQWLYYLMFIQFYQVPKSEAESVLEDCMDNLTLKEHLIAIVRTTKSVPVEEKNKKRDSKSINIKSKRVAVNRDVRAQFYSKIGQNKNKQPIASSPHDEHSLVDEKTTMDMMAKETPLPSMNHSDIVDIILECEVATHPTTCFLHHSFVYMHPLIPVLAATYHDANETACLCAWLLSNLKEEHRNEILINIFPNYADEDNKAFILVRAKWEDEKLISVVKYVYSRGAYYHDLVSRGFYIFYKNHPLLPFLRFVEEVIAHNDHDSLVELVAKFMLNISAHENTSNEVQFYEHFSRACLETLVSLRCSETQLEIIFKVLYKAKYAHNFTCGLQVQLIHKTLCVLCECGLKFNDLSSLVTDDTNLLNNQLDTIFQTVIKAEGFEKALELCSLYPHLACSQVYVAQVQHDLKKLQNSHFWDESKLRLSFWRKTEQHLFKLNCDPELAANVFEDESCKGGYTNDERARLILFALKWKAFAADTTIDTNEMTRLEKTMWTYKINQIVENKTIEAEDLFGKEFFTISSTHQKHDEITPHLLEDTLCSENKTDCLLKSREEEDAFERLVNILLDTGHVTEALQVSTFFEKTTNDLDIVKTCTLLAQGRKSVDCVSDNIKSILATTTSRHISISGILERSGSFSRPDSVTSSLNRTGVSDMQDFVFIEETQNALEKLTLRVKHGKLSCQKDLVTFKVASILHTSYEEIYDEDALYTLKLLLETGVDKRRQLSKQFIRAYSVCPDEVATFVGDSIIGLIRTITGEASPPDSEIASFDEVISLLQLTRHTPAVGHIILQETRTLLSEEKQNKNWAYGVELLIYAHHCFTSCCDIEGISSSLNTARSLTQALTRNLQYNLIVRMLTHLGRFKEMYYVIETLYEQHHFESMCRKGLKNESGLKQALLEFMERHHPNDEESYDLILLGFGMYRAYGERLQRLVDKKIEQVQEKLIKGPSKEIEAELKSIQKTLAYAAENFTREECLESAHKCLCMTRLVELQLSLLSSATCVLGLNTQQCERFVRKHTNFHQALIVADVYSFECNWVDAFYDNVLLRGDMTYLQQFVALVELSPNLLLEITNRIRSEKNSIASKNMRTVMNHVRDLKMKLKISKEIGYNELEKSLLEGPQGAFLRDQIF